MKTKLQPPKFASQYLPRLHLDQAIEKCQNAQIIAIHGPAGSGKTTFLAQTFERLPDSDGQKLWLSIDRSDYSVFELLRTLVDAISTALNVNLPRAKAILSAGHDSSIELVLTDLADILEANRSPLYLFLDDLHEVTDHDSRFTLESLLLIIARSARIFLTSRYSMPFALSRLRTSGQLLEIAWPDLQFRPTETATFLRTIHGLQLDDEAITALHGKVEGWAAGLQLVAMSLHNNERSSGFIAALSGRTASIGEYLLENVLSRMDPELAEFCIQISFLDHFDADLCTAVTGFSRAFELLYALERSSALIYSLDEERKWYRFHRLFSDFLYQRLKQEYLSGLSSLYLKAARWYEPAGMFDEAIRFSIMGHDVNAAVRLISEHGWNKIRDGNFSCIRTWLLGLSQKAFEEHPRLCVLDAWCLLFPGHLEAANQRLLTASRRIDDIEKAQGKADKYTLRLRAEVQVTNTILQQIRDDGPNPVDFVDFPIDSIAREDLFLGGMHQLSRAYVLRVKGDLTGGLHAAELATELAAASDSPLLQTFAGMTLSYLKFVQGHSQLARESYQSLLTTNEARGWGELLMSGFAHIRYSQVLYETGALDDALHSLEGGLRILKQHHSETLICWALLEKARCVFQLGNTKNARELVVLAKTAALRFGVKRVYFWALLLELQMSIVGGDRGLSEVLLSKVTETMESLPARRDQKTLTENEERGMVARAKVYLLSRQYQSCGRVCGEALKNAKSSRHIRNLIEIYLIQALLYFSTGYCSKAVQKLEAAISRAESSYFIQVFVEIYQCFPDFENLIVSMASTKNSHAGAIQSPFRVAVISLAERTSRTVMSASDLPRSHIDQVEVLTDRELQILQLLTKGCRNKEIGRQISVSEDTVKWHLKNIFSKLGVSSRVEAALCVSAT